MSVAVSLEDVTAVILVRADGRVVGERGMTKRGCSVRHWEAGTVGGWAMRFVVGRQVCNG